MSFGPPVPILRIFDVDMAKKFYLEFLGFELVFEHRFDEGFPLYMGIKCGDCVLHLSEHHGDASPGAQVRIAVPDVRALQEELTGKTYAFANPGVEEMPWQSLDMQLTDPFGNRLTFSSPVAES